jgi:hydrogenase maturation protein HypF
LFTNYRGFGRVGSLEAVAMPGGARAMREPLRNTLAHFVASMGWEAFVSGFTGTALHDRLAPKPVVSITSMIRSGTNAPLASSCGRLFDAVAGAVGIAFDRQDFERSWQRVARSSWRPTSGVTANHSIP